MKKFTPNGDEIKRLRSNRELRATQKELAHEGRISERKLRAIENGSAATPADVLDRLATALDVRRDEIVFAEDNPRLVQPLPQSRLEERPSEPLIGPRFDDEILSPVMDETELLRDVVSSSGLVTHFLTRLSPVTEGYAVDLLRVLESVTRERRDNPVEGREELGLRRRVRDLLVLLKGNDVWVYATLHLKQQPEGDELLPSSEIIHYRTETIIAFGPPGEYGETTIKVRVDNGRPWVCHPNKLPF